MTKTKAKKKVSLHYTFHVGSGIRDEQMFVSRSEIRDVKMIRYGIQDKTSRIFKDLSLKIDFRDLMPFLHVLVRCYQNNIIFQYVFLRYGRE
jgi:hypothetical protein